MVSAPASIKLNLGCGPKLWPDFINVDLPNNAWVVKPDIEADVKKLPFPDNYADEIHAIHLVEHFYVWEIGSVLEEWHRVLKPGGLLVLELPDIEKILTMWANGISGMAKTWFGLYGDPRSHEESMTHKWGYSFNMIREMLESRNFKNIIKKEPIFHLLIRDMRVECTK